MENIGMLLQKDRAMSRLISLLERRSPQGVEEIKGLYQSCGKAHVIGVTGPPGAGKSCLVAALIREFRKHDKTVGVLAVDPSSPYTGGALLGDRARMSDFTSDRGVYIRSFSARGASGGLAQVINDAVDVLDAFGKEVILIETVGVGQVEIDIAKIAHSVVLTLVPGYGDTLQAMKAGIMEIGDILAMNKSDQPGADKAVNDLAYEMPVVWEDREYQCANLKGGWPVPIVKVSAQNGDGVEELVSLLTGHLEFLKKDQRFDRICQERRNRQFLDILALKVRAAFQERTQTDQAIRNWVAKIERLEIDPYTACDQVVDLIDQGILHQKETPDNRFS